MFQELRRLEQHFFKGINAQSPEDYLMKLHSSWTLSHGTSTGFLKAPRITQEQQKADAAHAQSLHQKNWWFHTGNLRIVRMLLDLYVSLWTIQREIGWPVKPNVLENLATTICRTRGGVTNLSNQPQQLCNLHWRGLFRWSLHQG